jgi:sarcosine oxidase, subunit gamma
MVEPVPSVSALDPLAARMAAASWSGATLAAGAPRTQIGVRVRGEAAARAASALGLESPPGPNRIAAARGTDCFWLGPEEWLVVGAATERASLRQVLERAVGPDDGAVVDLSSARVTIDLSGPSARDVLSTCCALDLHPRAFGPGRCAQTLVGKAPVLLAFGDERPMFRVYVRPSFAGYVVGWLLDGMDGARAEAEAPLR